ncbi:MAG: hypothetical protein MR531_13515 [Lachnospiraceae bacterium]|nr:hypothetical protein [Lachnospiraceae bacterium]
MTTLNIGGYDYIKKPYTLNILLAKVKAILKQYEAQMVRSDYVNRENEGTLAVHIRHLREKMRRNRK